MKAKVLLLAAILLTGGFLFGQGGYKGSVMADITSEDGSPLPGAVAVLSGDTFTRSFVSDANGVVRWVGLVPSTYELKVSFTGFNTYVRPNIIVDTGQNVRLTVVLSPSTQQEELVVTAESPLMDSTKVGTSTVLTEEELNAVPQSRDPWSVIMTVPGVQTDRINIGGSEAGQQSNFASKGDDGSNATWVMDGIEFVDPAARGATQSYLDFSSFAQMSVTTGGADVNQRSGGAALNFVTKQGSNNHQGSIRLLYADQDFQGSHNNILRNNGQPFAGNSIGETFEKSFEIGGPIIKDRLWYWGAFSQNSITQLLINGQPDRTELRNVSLKIHGDLTSTTRFNAFYTEGDKIKNGRGGGVDRPPNTTWDQSGPSPIYKFEISQLFGQHTEIALLLARVDGGFALKPQGASSGQIGLDFTTFIWDNTTFIDYSTIRPVRQYEVKGNTFLSSSTLDHELTYGFSYKDATVNSLTTYGDDNLIAFHLGPDGQGGLNGFGVSLYRMGNATTDVEYTSAHIGDTMTYGNWTFKAGLRYDKQEGQNVPSSVLANPVDPITLPAVNFTGQASPFSWDNVAPRLGVTYTWGDENQYLVRSSLAQFYDTLGSGQIAIINPTFVRYSYHQWSDDNHNGLVDSNEIGPSLANDLPNPPDSQGAVDRIDPNLKSPQTNEFIAGFEWALSPEFTLGATATVRERSDELWRPFYGGITSADYRLVSGDDAIQAFDPFLNQNVTIPYYVLTEEGAAKNPQRGTILTNRPGYTEDYKGLEFTATKRLSNRWMLRASLTFQDWTRNVPPEAIQNPSNFRSGSNEDGGFVGIQSAGSGNRANVFFGSSTWTMNVNGLYQLPWDLTVSANINGREGFAFPRGYRLRTADDDGFPTDAFYKQDAFDAVRGDDVFLADFKLTKTFHMSGRTKVEIAAELFNAFNDDTILARELNLASSLSSEPREVVSPRIGRFSATVHF